MPVAIVGTFAAMAACGFSLNTLTLFGLVLAIGIVVDDAIVVVEAVEHHIEEGLSPRDAAIQAMDEVSGPVVAVGLVLTAVFIPCTFIQGIVGQFFRQFALTIAISTVISAFNSLTLSPALAVLLLRARKDGHSEALPRPGLVLVAAWAGYEFLGPWLETAARRTIRSDLQVECRSLSSLDRSGSWEWLPGGWLPRSVNRLLGLFFRIFNRGFNWVTEGYVGSVGWLLKGSIPVLVVYAGLLYLTYDLFSKTPTGFIPSQDKGYLLVNVRLPDSSSLDRTAEVMRQIEAVAGKAPGVRHTVGIAGQSILLGANAPNFGTMYVMLDDFHSRSTKHLSGDVIGEHLRSAFETEVQDGVINVLGAPPIDGLGTAGGFKIVIEDRGDNGLGQLQAVSEKIVEEANGMPGLQGVFTNFRADTTWLHLDIDRSQVKSMGVSMADVFEMLQVHFGSLYINDFNRFGRTWQVNIQADAKFRMTWQDLRKLNVRSDRGHMVPLFTFTNIREVSGPVMLNRYNLYSAALINANSAWGPVPDRRSSSWSGSPRDN